MNFVTELSQISDVFSNLTQLVVSGRSTVIIVDVVGINTEALNNV
jgi:hypothetical protein